MNISSIGFNFQHISLIKWTRMHIYQCISTLSIFIHHSFAWWNISLCKLISVFMFLYFLSSIGPYLDQLLAIFIQFTFNFYILWVLPNFSLHIFLKKKIILVYRESNPNSSALESKRITTKPTDLIIVIVDVAPHRAENKFPTFKLFSDAWLLGI